MDAQLSIGKAEQHSPISQPFCEICSIYEFNLCQAAAEAAWAVPNAKPDKIQQIDRSVPARKTISREQDFHDAVPIICSGWAASVVMLANGSRQILSFLLPGDIVSTALLFDAKFPCLVEAITDVRYRTFNRAELKELIFKHNDLFEKISKVWIEEKTRGDQLIVDLGRRTADERIARLLLGLFERLMRRNMVHGDPAEVEFPLRQHHIADATGLTPVHVSKVLSEFRRNGLIKISDRSLTILDQAGFRRVAGIR